MQLIPQTDRDPDSLGESISDLTLFLNVFLIHSSADGHLGCFQILAIVNCAAMNIGVHISFLTGVSSFLGYVPRSDITGSNGSSIFSFFEET